MLISFLSSSGLLRAHTKKQRICIAERTFAHNLPSNARASMRSAAIFFIHHTMGYVAADFVQPLNIDHSYFLRLASFVAVRSIFLLFLLLCTQWFGYRLLSHFTIIAHKTSRPFSICWLFPCAMFYTRRTEEKAETIKTDCLQPGRVFNSLRIECCLHFTLHTRLKWMATKQRKKSGIFMRIAVKTSEERDKSKNFSHLYDGALQPESL